MVVFLYNFFMTTLLHTHTEYTLLGSTIKLEKLIDFAFENSLDSLVITDHNNLYGVADFIYLCKKNNIKPIIGLDLDVEDFRLVLLARNYEGYKELMHLSSKKLSGTEIKVKDINVDNLFVIDHPTEGYYPKNSKMLKIQNYLIGTQKPTSENHIYMSNTSTLYKEETEGLSILKALSSGDYNLKEVKTLAYDEQKVSPKQQKKIKFIIDQCNIVFPDHKDILPKFNKKERSSTILKDLVIKGLKGKFGDEVPDRYAKRIKEELKVIITQGFSDYFLIIQDLIAWARKEGIEVGPGRGSAAGSLASYLLGITEVDPLEYNLLFERFLNPERVSLPDIDIDIQDTRRDEVINYLFEKYGKNKVALISTFQTIGAKNAIRDTGRVLGMPLRDVDAISKAIPLNMHLRQAKSANAKFRALVTKKKEYENLFRKAQLIEGLPRQLGTHAAGLVLSEVDIVNKVPVLMNSSNKLQLQFSMTHLERHGLLKIDLLGLRNLTIFNDIVSEIKKNYGKKIDFNKLPFNDPKVFRLLTEGQTNGIFQFESPGIKAALRKTRINSFNDVIAMLSLFRPGPMENIEEYGLRKNEGKVYEKVSPEYDEIVRDTYGIIIYQEQIMLIAQAFAGMSFAKADVFRRAIGKKNLELLSSLKKEFIDGAINNGHDIKVIKKVYASIKMFANYGFNKSHAVAYAFLAYRLAYLKQRFPIEFYTSLLNASTGSQSSIAKYVKEAKENRIIVNGPHINKSIDKVFNEDKKIYLTFNIIKGIGAAAAKKIIDERQENGEYKDFFDFVTRAINKGIGESTIELLIKSGSMDHWGDVPSLLAALPIGKRYTEMITIKKDKDIVVDEKLVDRPKIMKVDGDLEKVIKDQEKLMGISFIKDPMSKYEIEDKLNSILIGEQKTVVAKISSIELKTDKNGNEMAWVTFSDSTMSISATVFYSAWSHLKDTKIGSIVKVTIKAKEYNQRITYNVIGKWEVING